MFHNVRRKRFLNSYWYGAGVPEMTDYTQIEDHRKYLIFKQKLYLLNVIKFAFFSDYTSCTIYCDLPMKYYKIEKKEGIYQKFKRIKRNLPKAKNGIKENFKWTISATFSTNSHIPLTIMWVILQLWAE